jgi:hypothetical protein
MQSHSEVLGIMNSTYELWGEQSLDHNTNRQPNLEMGERFKMDFLPRRYTHDR